MVGTIVIGGRTAPGAETGPVDGEGGTDPEAPPEVGTPVAGIPGPGTKADADALNEPGFPGGYTASGWFGK